MPSSDTDAGPFSRRIIGVKRAPTGIARPYLRCTDRALPVLGPRMFDPVDTNDLGEFLISRRAKLSLQQAGLPDFGGRRRVPGLRREEVALLAGMSAEYYKRLERGNAKGVSDAVIDGVSRALQLDAAEHAHLCDLVRAANAGTRPRAGDRHGA